MMRTFVATGILVLGLSFHSGQALANYDIDGYVRDSSGNPAGCIKITKTGEVGGVVFTDASGYYLVANNRPGLTYTLTPSKSGCTFSPPSGTYENLGQDWHNQDYTAIGEVPPASPDTACARADLDHNGYVNAIDLSIFAEGYGQRGCYAPDWCGGRDLNQDGQVDAVDLAVFARSYGCSVCVP